MMTAERNDERSFPLVTRHSSGGGSSDEGDGESLLDKAKFFRNRKERSTVLVRRFYKNNQKVFPF